VRRCGRNRNKRVRDRGTEMRLTERTRELIPETRDKVRHIERNDQLYVTRMMLVAEQD